MDSICLLISCHLWFLLISNKLIILNVLFCKNLMYCTKQTYTFHIPWWTFFVCAYLTNWSIAAKLSTNCSHYATVSSSVICYLHLSLLSMVRTICCRNSLYLPSHRKHYVALFLLKLLCFIWWARVRVRVRWRWDWGNWTCKPERTICCTKLDICNL